MTTNEALVERVARAICAANHENPDEATGGHPPSFDSAPTWTLYKGDATAAIAALTPPAAEGEVVAYLKEWISDGEPRSRVDRKSDHERWLGAYFPTVTPLYRLAHAAPKVAGVEMVEGVPVRKLLDSMTTDYVRMMRTTLAAIETGRNEPLMVVRDQIRNALAAAPSAPGSGEG